MPILTTMLLVAGALGQQPEAVEQKLTSELLGLETRLMAAAQQKKVAEDEALVAPEFAFSMGLEGRPNYVLNRSEWTQGIRYYDLNNFEISSLTAHDFGNSVVTHFRLVRSARMGRKVDLSGAFVVTDVWAKTKGAWQLVRRFVSQPAGVPADN
jgi:hypothetical protein